MTKPIQWVNGRLNKTRSVIGLVMVSMLLVSLRLLKISVTTILSVMQK